MLDEFKNIFNDLKKLNIYHFGSYLSASQYLLAYELVNKYLKPNSKALDWGTGSGHFSLFLLKQGYEVDAFTIEKECNLEEYLSKSFPQSYRIAKDQNPLSSLPFEDQSFDLVVSIGVLEHVRETNNNEINSLNEIRRVLKPEGIFICYHFPNKFSWIEAITKHLDSKHNHNFKYTSKDIIALNSECQIRLLDFRRYGILPRNSLRVLPNNLVLTKIINFTDTLLSILLNPFCQNYYFVSRKTDQKN